MVRSIGTIANTEAVLGIHRRGHQLRVEPCVPSDWPGFEVDCRFGTATYHITVKKGAPSRCGVLSIDGMRLVGDRIPLVDDGRNHDVHLVVG